MMATVALLTGEILRLSVKIGDLVRIKSEHARRYTDIPEHPANARAILVLDTKNNGNIGPLFGTMKISNEPENLWVPTEFFEVISENR